MLEELNPSFDGKDVAKPTGHGLGCYLGGQDGNLPPRIICAASGADTGLKL
jgi:hypothetical protein